MELVVPQEQPVVEDIVLCELVGGPLDGDMVPWPPNKQELEFKYRYGMALYKKETEKTALYVKDTSEK